MFWEFNVCSLIASKFGSCLHCYIMFWTCPAFSLFAFHIPLEVLYDNWSLLKAVNNALTSSITLYNYVMLNSNKPIKVNHLQKLANQSVLNGALVIEMVNNSFSESKKNCCRLIKWRRPKIFISTDFTKYLSYFEVQKNSKVVNV